MVMITKPVLGTGLFLLFTMPTAGTELKGEFLVASNYVWRGITLTEDSPAIFGGFDYANDKGWFGSAQVVNVSVDGEPEQQVVVRGGARRSSGEWLFDAGAVAYEYTRGDCYDPEAGRLVPNSSNGNDFVEFFVGTSYGNGEFRYYRSENYLGSGKLSNYYDFNYAMPMINGAKLIAHYGFTDSSAINERRN